MKELDDKIIALGTVFIIIVGVLTNVFVRNKEAEASIEQAKIEQFHGSWACMADTYACPDGTQVGRVPPYCHFQNCP